MSVTALINLQFETVNAQAFTGIQQRLNDLQTAATRVEAAINKTTAGTPENTALSRSLTRINGEVANLQGSLVRGNGLVNQLQNNLSRLAIDLKFQTTEAGIARVNRQIQQTQAELNRLNSMGSGGGAGQSDGGGALGSLVGLVKGGIVLEGVRRIGAAVVGYGQAALNASSETLQFKTALTTMLQSKEKAEALNAEIVKLAASTPFELKDVQEYTKRLLAMGVAQKDIIPVMKSLGDISATVGKEKLPQIVLAFGQVKTAGRLMGSELRQFSEAGVPLLSLIAKNMNEVGKTTKYTEATIKDMVHGGKIGFEQVRDAMISATQAGGQFGGLAAAASKTVSGQISNLNDKIYQTSVSIGDALTPAALKAVSIVSDLVAAFGEFVGVSDVEKIQQEQVELNALAITIGQATDNQNLRNLAIAELQQKYPTFYAMLNKEKDLTEEISRVLKIVNGEYERKIRLAGIAAFAQKQEDKAIATVQGQKEAQQELNVEFGLTYDNVSKISEANLRGFYINKLLDENGIKSAKQRAFWFEKYYNDIKFFDENQGKFTQKTAAYIEGAFNTTRYKLIQISNATQNSKKAFQEAAEAQKELTAEQSKDKDARIEGKKIAILKKELEIENELALIRNSTGDTKIQKTATLEQQKKDLIFLKGELKDLLGEAELPIKPTISEKDRKKAEKHAEDLAKFLENSLQSVQKLIRKENEATAKLHEKGERESLERIVELNKQAQKAQIDDYAEKQKDFVQQYKEKGLSANNPKVRKILNEYGELERATKRHYNEQLLNDTEAYLKKVREIVIKSNTTREIEEQEQRIAHIKTLNLEEEFSAELIAEIELQIRKRKNKEAERVELQGVEAIAQQRADALGTSFESEKLLELEHIKNKYVAINILEQEQYAEAARKRREQKAINDIKEFDESQKRNVQNLENENNEEITYLNQKRSAGTIGEYEYQEYLKDIQRRYARERLIALLEATQKEIDIRKAAIANPDITEPEKKKITTETESIKAEQVKLQKELSQLDIDEQKEKEGRLKKTIDQYADAYGKIANIVADFTKRATDAELARLDRLIDKQKEVVESATENAGKGAAQAVQIERDRLKALMDEREAAAARQAQIDAALAAAQFGIAVANGVVAITEQAKLTFPLNIIAIGATVAGLAVAGIAVGNQVAQAQKDASALGFQTGGFTGYGQNNEVAGVVHKNEFVSTAEVTARHRPLLEELHRNPNTPRASSLTSNIGSISAISSQMQAQKQFIEVTVNQNEGELRMYLKSLAGHEDRKQKEIKDRERRERLYTSVSRK